MRPSLVRALLYVVGLTAAGHFAESGLRADDWPQWLGPQRDGVWRETGILETFPEGGPKVLWRTPLGGGYTGPAVAEGRVYVTDRILKPGASLPREPFARSMLPRTVRVL